MALLQISEPGLSAAPHQRRLAAGIDLGTTNSLVATVRQRPGRNSARPSGALFAAVGGELSGFGFDGGL